jgi:hypothetical protein
MRSVVTDGAVLFTRGKTRIAVRRPRVAPLHASGGAVRALPVRPQLEKKAPNNAAGDASQGT